MHMVLIFWCLNNEKLQSFCIDLYTSDINRDKNELSPEKKVIFHSPIAKSDSMRKMQFVREYF